ncbi:MAG: disulfide bond formation protein B [Pseudomonadota bacterium]
MRLLQSLARRRRAANLVAALLCFAMVGYALYSQYRLGLQPCPLCIFERLAITGLAVAFVLAVLPGQGQLLLHRLFALLIGAVALTGAGIAGRHVYIQHLPPDRVPVCGATLDYMLDVFPPADVVRKVLTGSGECAKVDWTFLGLSMPGWVLVCALLLGAAGVALNWVRPFRQAASPEA